MGHSASSGLRRRGSSLNGINAFPDFQKVARNGPMGAFEVGVPLLLQIIQPTAILSIRIHVMVRCRVLGRAAAVRLRQLSSNQARE